MLCPGCGAATHSVTAAPGSRSRNLPPFTAFRGATKENIMADDLTKRGQPDRSLINMSEDHEVKYWTRHLGVSREELQRAVDKVGNAAAAVRKELGKAAA
jgi:hypothetical protein